MKKSQPPNKQASPSHGNANTTISAQLVRLIARLRIGSIDTFTAAKELNICRPGARICDLRNGGYKILTNLVTLTDDWGRTHRRVAVYTLIAEPSAKETA
jgi:hypothetical protein